MKWRAAAIAEAVDGVLSGPDTEVTGATIDSRSVVGGELFGPVRAARDGHDFIGGALDAGAAAYLSAQAAGPGTAILVGDTMIALADLGRAARSRLGDRVVGITGSAGKTSTKDLLAAVLGGSLRTAASERSFNNELGVPLTLLNAADDIDVVVVEMGARGVGHIATLCSIARPTIGVVTNVGLAHTEMLGSLDNVARAKAELIEALPSSGTAVLNADDGRVMAMRSVSSAEVLTYGLAGGDVRACDVVLDGELRPSFRLASPWGTVEVHLAVRGAHNAANAAAAAAVALVQGVSIDDVATGLGGAHSSPWRMELSRSLDGGLVLNDAYNANPASTEAALRSLAALDVKRRVAVLGPMCELGEHAAAEHARIGALARSLGIDLLVTVGAPLYEGEDVADIAGAVTLVGPVEPGDAVLVKGSRAAGLERLATVLTASVERMAAW